MTADRPGSASDRSLAAVQRLRAAAAALERSGNEELAGVAADLRRYEREAPLGRSLDDVLGLTPHGGAGGWWDQERRARRDALIRELRREHFADLEVRRAAHEIAALANARRNATAPARDTREELVDAALRTGLKFPGPKRLSIVLGIPIGD